MSAATTAASVAGVYAAALLQIANERGVGPAVLEACQTLPGALTREVIATLDHPSITRDQAKSALSAALVDAPKEIRDLLLLLVDRHRLTDAPAILSETVRQANEASGAVTVRVLTAAEPSAAAKANLDQAMHRFFGANARIETATDSALVAGMTVRCGDILIDGSVRRAIAEMKAALLAAPVGATLWSA